jgi:cytochrome c-type biogenesis protein CcmF
MWASLGHYSLALAIVVAAVMALQSLIAFIPRMRGAGEDDALRTQYDEMMAASLARAGAVVFGLITFSFMALVVLFIQSDFSVSNVYDNSHSLKPFIYKISGVWGSHEGSVMLWMFLSGAYLVLGGRLLKTAAPIIKRLYFSIAHYIFAAFGLFVILLSNPFWRIFPMPKEGLDLNPLLQDPALALHPPFLYLGYVGTMPVFALALAMLCVKSGAQKDFKALQLLTLIAFGFLTIGIGLGSFWAYYELGWGGYWFWDPVENISTFPWLALLALLHLIPIEERAKDAGSFRFIPWLYLVALLTFVLSIFGTFIVRSGLLTSVHAFALDPERGIFLMIVIAAIALPAFMIYGLCAFAPMTGAKEAEPSPFHVASREGGMWVQSIIMMLALGMIFIGTFYPLIIEALGGAPLAVGAPFFNKTLTPLLFILAPLMALAPYLSWRKAFKGQVLKPFQLGVMAAIYGSLLTFWLADFKVGVLEAMGALAGYWILGGTAFYAAQMVKRKIKALKIYAMIVAHMGFGLMIVAISVMAIFMHEDMAYMKAGDRLEVDQYRLTYEAPYEMTDYNFTDKGVRLSVKKAGDVITTLTPARRHYKTSPMVTTESAFYIMPLSILYVTVGDETELKMTDGSVMKHFPVRVQYHEGVFYIWLGAILMALGAAMAVIARFKIAKREEQ